MATSLDFARELAAAADRDLVLLRKNIADPEIPIEVLGFHCQQAVEKSIKSVLAIHEIEFRKIHDIKTLVDLAENAHLALPEGEPLEALTPFAVEFRYHTIPQGSSPVTREEMIELSRKVRQWAEIQMLEAQAKAQHEPEERSAPPGSGSTPKEGGS